MASGAIWMVFGRLLERSIGLISTIIVARILSPDDFGLVAMATSLMAVLEVIGAFSLDSAIIQNSKSNRSHYDTAWTINLIYAFGTALVLSLLAYPAATFYSEPRLIGVMFALAIAALINGLGNIGVVEFRKELDFRKEFTFRLINRLILFVTTVTAAVVFRNYWALVIGMVLGAALGVTTSYIVHNFRPRLSLAVWREMFKFSKWMILGSISNFIYHRSADFFVAKVVGAKGLGLYSISYEFANLAGSEIAAPLNRALLPGYSKLKESAQDLKRSFLQVTSVLALVCFPAAIGIGFVADELVALLLGAQWGESAQLIRVIALAAAINVLQNNCNVVYIALGTPKTNTLIVFAGAMLMLGSMGVLVPQFGVMGAAYSAIVTAALSTPLNLFITARRLKFSLLEITYAIWRPTVATVFMVVSTTWLCQHLIDSNLDLHVVVWLALKVFLGAMTYTAGYILLWAMAGRPDGPEKLLFRLVQRPAST